MSSDEARKRKAEQKDDDSSSKIRTPSKFLPIFECSQESQEMSHEDSRHVERHQSPFPLESLFETTPAKKARTDAGLGGNEEEEVTLNLQLSQDDGSQPLTQLLYESSHNIPSSQSQTQLVTPTETVDPCRDEHDDSVVEIVSEHTKTSSSSNGYVHDFDDDDCVVEGEVKVTPGLGGSAVQMFHTASVLDRVKGRSTPTTPLFRPPLAHSSSSGSTNGHFQQKRILASSSDTESSPNSQQLKSKPENDSTLSITSGDTSVVLSSPKVLLSLKHQRWLDEILRTILSDNNVSDRVDQDGTRVPPSVYLPLIAKYDDTGEILLKAELGSMFGKSFNSSGEHADISNSYSYASQFSSDSKTSESRRSELPSSIILGSDSTQLQSTGVDSQSSFKTPILSTSQEEELKLSQPVVEAPTRKRRVRKPPSLSKKPGAQKPKSQVSGSIGQHSSQNPRTPSSSTEDAVAGSRGTTGKKLSLTPPKLQSVEEMEASANTQPGVLDVTLPIPTIDRMDEQAGPGLSQPEELVQLDAITEPVMGTLKPGSRAFACWHGNEYYPCTLEDQVDEKNWKIQFDVDRVTIQIRSHLILPIEVIQQGQKVCIDAQLGPAGKGEKLPVMTIVSHRQDKLGDIRYAVEAHDGTVVPVTRSDIILTKQQVANIRRQFSQSAMNASDLDLDNVMAPFGTSPGPTRRSSRRAQPDENLDPGSMSSATAGTSATSESESTVAPRRGRTKKSESGVGKSTVSQPRKSSAKSDPVPKPTVEAKQTEVPASKVITSQIKNGLFSGMVFIVTSSGSGMDVDDIQQKILDNGGDVAPHVNLAQLTRKKVILISNKQLRTPLYVQCLAASIPCIHYLWVNHTIENGMKQDEKNFLLLAAKMAHPLTEEMTSDEASTLESEGEELQQQLSQSPCLEGIKIMLVSKDVDFQHLWEATLVSAGAEVIRNPPRSKSTAAGAALEFPKCDVVITRKNDPLEDSVFVERARDKNIPVVSSLWAIDSIFHWRKMKFDKYIVSPP